MSLLRRRSSPLRTRADQAEGPQLGQRAIQHRKLELRRQLNHNTADVFSLHTPVYRLHIGPARSAVVQQRRISSALKGEKHQSSGVRASCHQDKTLALEFESSLYSVSALSVVSRLLGVRSFSCHRNHVHNI